MATPKHPQGGGSITPQTEGGAHPRGTDAKNYTRESQDQPGPDTPAKGEHIFPDDGRPQDPTQVPDARRNPGIMSSGGTTDSGEPGIDERDADAS
ncbi:hypothetical protein [Arenibaculum pallidiluteum]|uniref:hypothetical protein n=1 Tax=Arenibaculum pallidiluteum TaxID=2812559 RepID=UPI001A964A80|nr:hypothetical protein [Arenibaculum pallidiluteum]